MDHSNNNLLRNSINDPLLVHIFGICNQKLDSNVAISDIVLHNKSNSYQIHSHQWPLPGFGVRTDIKSSYFSHSYRFI